MAIPKPVTRKRGPSPVYDFASLKAGISHGKHVEFDSDERDRKFASIRALCGKYTKASAGLKEFKCYLTETGVFYWREK